jgi:aspartate 1-decarboxylase
VIIATFADVDAAEAHGWKPTVVRVDAQNRMIDEGVDERPGPDRPAVPVA